MMKKMPGFTLVEMLVVLVLIGILVAIALPKVYNSRKAAIKSSVMSDIRNFTTAVSRATITNGTAPTDLADIPYTLSKGNSINMANKSGTLGYHIAVFNQDFELDVYYCSYYIGTGVTSAGESVAFVDGNNTNNPKIAPSSDEGVITCDGF